MNLLLTTLKLICVKCKNESVFTLLVRVCDDLTDFISSYLCHAACVLSHVSCLVFWFPRVFSVSLCDLSIMFSSVFPVPPFLSVSVVSFMPPLCLPLVISPVLLPPLASPVPRLVFTVCVFSFFRLFIGSLFVAFPCLLMFLDVPRVSLYSACRLLVWI